MPEPSGRRPLSPHTKRARQLLVGAAIGGHLAALTCVGAFLVAGGVASGVSAAVAGVVTLAFFTIGQAVQVMVADEPPRKVLFAAMASYAIRVSLLGLLLQLAMVNASRFEAMDAVAVVVTTIATVIVWLGTEFWVYTRLRIPVYDSDEPSEVTK